MFRNLMWLITVVVLLGPGCAGPRDARIIRESPMPPKYIYTVDESKMASHGDGSLFTERVSYFQDRKARGMNDLITVLVTEQSSASQKATTEAERDSSADYGVEDFFGAPLDLGFRYDSTNRFSPTVKGDADSSISGKGVTTREGKLVATLTAKVVEVHPNGNMVIEGRKEILVNNEKDILVLKGIVRPDDITDRNTINSSLIGDAQIYLVGKGDLNDKQGSGWLVRFLDKAWPF